MALGLLMNVVCPDIQKKFHGDLVPALLKMMESESLIKMKSQAVACSCNFVRGLVNTEDDEDEMTPEEIEQNK